MFGRIHEVTEEEKKKEICTSLCRKFTDDEAYLEKEMKNAFPRVCCLELDIDHMTGKLVKRGGMIQNKSVFWEKGCTQINRPDEALIKKWLDEVL